MATFKAEVQNRRADGTYNVRIRVTHNRIVRRISTNIYATDNDLTRSLKLKNQKIADQCAELIRQCREVCNSLGYTINALSADELVERIKEQLQGGREFQLEFIAYARQKTGSMQPGTASNYLTMLCALQRFIKRDTLYINEITADFLHGFEKFIESEPSQRGNNRKDAKEESKPKSGRAVSAYLAYIRAIHNRAKEEFNDEDRGLIRIPYSPFKNYKIKAQPITRKRALTVEEIQAIIDIPYESENLHKESRFNLAKDCFILSFVLIGMNSIDLYYADTVSNSVLVYNRQKTKGRRDDKAEMKVKLEGCIDRLLEKYADPKGKRLFGFYDRFASPEGFNKAINAGLKKIGDKLNIDRLEFYTARHSWATIARSSKVGIDKATVHEALNHVDSSMAVTDIYIDRDWSVIWNANKKVLDLFDWTAIGYDIM